MIEKKGSGLTTLQALANHADLQMRTHGKFSNESYERACAVYEHAMKVR